MNLANFSQIVCGQLHDDLLLTFITQHPRDVVRMIVPPEYRNADGSSSSPSLEVQGGLSCNQAAGTISRPTATTDSETTVEPADSISEEGCGIQDSNEAAPFSTSSVQP
ncbi:hypothetical protein RB195_007947 [Necator americanus]|uniref:Uncharacterized protein n=1 Tax=Necator americanus TaxID=51031 RepID=A0ABR1BZP3_NECAM